RLSCAPAQLPGAGLRLDGGRPRAGGAAGGSGRRGYHHERSSNPFEMSKTGALAAVFVLGCVLGTGALADSGPPTDTTTTPTVTTTTTTTTTTTEPEVLPDGVTIAGVAVGGLAPADAYAAVRAAFGAPVTLVFAGRRIRVAPSELGAVGYAQRAVAAAGHAAPQSTIPLQVAVRPGPLRRYLRGLARRLNRKPVDAALQLRAGRPFVSKEEPGIALQVEP